VEIEFFQTQGAANACHKSDNENGSPTDVAPSNRWAARELDLEQLGLYLIESFDQWLVNILRDFQAILLDQLPT
jgi:hypothetical protein